MPQETLSVALIYQAEQLHQHLRQALGEFGARIVYEAHAREYDAAALDASGAQVVIINLDPEVNDEFEALSDLLLDETRRVIFNDGEVTSRLEGWDLARWTRHLAAKVVGATEVHPPRPEGSEAIPVKIKSVPHAPAQAANEPTPAADFDLEGDSFQAAMSADTGAAMERERAALRTESEAVRPDLIPRAPAASAQYKVDPAELTMHLPVQDAASAPTTSREPPTLEIPLSEVGPAATRREFPTLELAADALTRAAAELEPTGAAPAASAQVASAPDATTDAGFEAFDAGGIGFDEGASLDFVGSESGDAAVTSDAAATAAAEEPFELTFDESMLAAIDAPFERTPTGPVEDETPSFDAADLPDMPELTEGEVARMPSAEPEEAQAEDFAAALGDFGFLDQEPDAPRGESIMDLDTLLMRAGEAEEEKRKGSLGKVQPVFQQAPVAAKADAPRPAPAKAEAAKPEPAKPEPAKPAARATEPAKERTLADFEHALSGLSLEPTDDDAVAATPAPEPARAATPVAAKPSAPEPSFGFSLEPIEGEVAAKPSTGRAVFGTPEPEPVRAASAAPFAPAPARATSASDDGLSLEDFDFNFDENTEIRTDSIVRMGVEPALDDMSVDLDTEIDALLQREASLVDDALPGHSASAPRISRVFVLGASIGGPDAVREFLSALPADVPALFVLAQHMGADFLDLMVQQLSRSSKLKVRTVADGDVLAHGEVVIAPLDGRLELDAEGRATIGPLATPSPYTPSIDQVMRDVADRFGAGAGAIIFSGMAHDAIDGARHLVAKGGCVWVQEPSSCVISSMVDGAVEAGVVSYTARPSELARHLVEHCAK